MLRAIFLIACFLVVVTAPANAFADPGGQTTEAPVDEEAADDGDDGKFFDGNHRQEIYEKSRLQKRRAVLYSLALPGLGNFYAEQYALGTLSLTALVFSGMFLGFGLINGHPDLVRLGAITTGVTYVGSATSAYLGVRQYNAELRRNLHLDATFAPIDDSALIFEWSWRF